MRPRKTQNRVLAESLNAGPISSLSPDDIPIKLRCAICSKLAVNAFRLPCCEQAICETCKTTRARLLVEIPAHSDGQPGQLSLPPSCPVCEHSPLGAEDCKPNKSLRTTIRVFIRTAEKKREANRPKEPKDSAPTTPVDATKTTPSVARAGAKDAVATSDTDGVEAPTVSSVQDTTPSTDKVTATLPDNAALSSLAGPKDHDSGDAQNSQQGNLNASPGPTPEDVTGAHNGDGPVVPKQTMAEATKISDNEGSGQNSFGMGTGFGNMMFPGAGDFSQMQMMMSMQNGMGANAFGGFPMMGTANLAWRLYSLHARANTCTGMGMDPVMMQNMYMNGGFQGMGMNGMNGMGGFGGGFGQGSNNNWNGAQSWSFDQNNYNQSGLGMDTGDYGDFNAGFQTGYNQGQFNDFRRNNFGRGRAPARGFFGGHGRGGYHADGGMSSHQDRSQQWQQGSSPYPQVQAISDAKGDLGDDKAAGDDGVGLARQPGDDGGQGAGQKPGQGGDADAPHEGMSRVAFRENLGNEAARNLSQNKGTATAHELRPDLPAPDVPINAPTGPKAMRQGLPNTSLHHLRARGYQVDPLPVTVGADKPAPDKQPTPDKQPALDKQPASNKQPVPDKQLPPDDARRPLSRCTDRENEKTTGVSCDHSRGRSVGRAVQELGARDCSRSASAKDSRQRNRSRSRSVRSSHRQRRQRSPSADAEKVDEGRRRKRARSGRRPFDEPRKDKRSPPASPDESRKPGHRGHRDREPEGRKGRDRRRQDGRRRPSRRSRRSRDRERMREYEHARRRDRESDQDKDRRERKERLREKDRDRDDRQGGGGARPLTSRRPSPVDRALDRPPGPHGRNPGPRASNERPDRDRRESPEGAGQGGTPKNEHTLEREARNRERLLKEAQRMAGFAGLAGSKRGRDGGGGDGDGRKARRGGRRDKDEERMRRLEAEREGGRWD